MTDEVRDFTALSDDEVMNLSSDQIASMASADEERRVAEEEKAKADEEARLAAEAEAAANADPDAQETGGEEGIGETDEEKEARLAAEAEAEAALSEEEREALRVQREEAAKQPVEKEAGGKGTKVETGKQDAAFDADEAAKLFAPFKANGRNMTIRNADEGVRLMQLGAGYNSKMEELKPKLAIIRTLEREGLLDNDKLGFLIDLHKKNPEAIGRLVKDSGVDVLDLDESKVAAYKSGNYGTSTKEIEMDSVLDGLKHTASYGKLMSDVADSWDKASKVEVGNNPAVLNVISNHMEAGFYDTIVDELNRKKALGEIPSGTPFLKAYAQIGDELNAAGAFGQPNKEPARKLVTPGKEQARVNSEAEKRRAAAAPTGKSGAAVEKKPAQVDIGKLSDEEFQKMFANR